MARRIRIVVLNYNGGDHVGRCIDALTALDRPDDGTAEIEIVVIDNDSIDGSAAAVVAAHPEIKLIQTGANLGFVANNLALNDLDGIDYVALVNNDAFVEPAWLTPLVEALDTDPGLGAVQSKILFADRVIEIDGVPFEVVNNVGGVITTQGYGTDRGWGEPDRGQFDEPAEVFAWSGGSVLLRPRYLAGVGLFEERLFLYYEDTDLSWRGRAQGWRYRCEPRSVVRHLHAASSGTGTEVFRYYNERNRLLLLVRNAPAAMAWWAALRHPLSTLSYARLGDGIAVRSRVKAYRGFLAQLPAALKARRTLRRRSTVPAAELTAWFVDPD
jgi:N-acetylglucosaminyl-diphospho-decaprenol L-rhamnosyltransferase